MGKKVYEQNDAIQSRKPIVLQFFTRKAPSQEEQIEMAKQGYNWDGKKWRYVGTISDAGGKPSTDNRTSAQRNKDYWHWWKGAKDRWTASWNNGTNPVKGALDSGLGYVNPATAIPSAIYDAYHAYDLLSSPQGLAKTWGLFKQGNLGKAAASAVGDALTISDLVPGMPETPNIRPRTSRSTPIDMNVVRLLESNLPRIAGALPTQQMSEASPLNQILNRISQGLSQEDFMSDRIRDIINIIKQGNTFAVSRLSRYVSPEQMLEVTNAIPESKYLKPITEYNNPFDWEWDLRKVRKIINNESGADLEYSTLLRNNPYSDNPIYQDFKDKFPGIEVYDASIRSAIEGPRTAENNLVLVDYLRSNPDIFDRVPNSDLAVLMRNILRNNRNGFPAEYVHVNSALPYDGSYPVNYYRGSYAVEGLDKNIMLENGLLAKTGDSYRGIPGVTGLFTDADLRKLSPEQLKKFIFRSRGIYAEGSHGTDYQGGTTSHFLKYLLTRDLTARKDMERLLKDMNAVISSGYTPGIHSLSFDSFPIWEKQLLNRINKGLAMPITNELLRSIGVSHSFKNNSLGTVAKYEASPELLEALKTAYKPKIDKWGYIPTTDTEVAKYLIENTSDPNTFMVTFDGKELGTFRQRTSEELMNMLNEARRKLYRKNMDLYPGDITPTEHSYLYDIPIITAITKKKGGKLNARLVKKKY